MSGADAIQPFSMLRLLVILGVTAVPSVGWLTVIESELSVPLDEYEADGHDVGADTLADSRAESLG